MFDARIYTKPEAKGNQRPMENKWKPTWESSRNWSGWWLSGESVHVSVGAQIEITISCIVKYSTDCQGIMFSQSFLFLIFWSCHFLMGLCHDALLRSFLSLAAAVFLAFLFTWFHSSSSSRSFFHMQKGSCLMWETVRKKGEIYSHLEIDVRSVNEWMVVCVCFHLLLVIFLSHSGIVCVCACLRFPLCLFIYWGVTSDW